MTNHKSKKQLQLDDLHNLYQACTACPLGTMGRQRIVFGSGNPDAKLMLIGEAPGREEDEQGEPFVGRSGKLLTTALANAGIDRSEIFITNIVKCRPPNNRMPKPTETFTCKKLLLFNQISIIQPHIIVPVGACALKSFINIEQQKLKLSQLHGQPFQSNNILVVPFYHPAYILRNRSKMSDFLSDINNLKLLYQKSL